MTDESDWTDLALNDDALVVQLLVDLKQTILHRTSQLPTSSSKHTEQPLKLEWSVRQRRSKQVCRKKSERASPTTPLSWSGGADCSTSASGGCGGFEESSSLPAKTLDTARSKVAITNETPTAKRSRRKKTLPEIKEEESSLLKERRNLKNQLANLRSNLENERAMNERLKRLKVDLLSKRAAESVRTATGTDEINLSQKKQIKVPSNSTLVMQITDVCNNSSSNTFQQQHVEGRESSFVLPDLNLPVEDN